MIKTLNIEELKLKVQFLEEELKKTKSEYTKYKTSMLRHKSLLDGLSTGLVLRTFDKKIIDCNQAYADICGRTREEMLSLEMNDVTPDKYRVQEMEQLEIVIKTGQFGPYEKEYIHKDGHLVPVRLNGKLIEKDGEICFWASVEDISDKKQAENALLESQEKYKSLFNQTDSAILVIEDNKFVDCNDAVVKMLGYENKTQVLQTHPSELSPERQGDGRSSYEKIEEMMALAIKNKSHRFEWTHRKANGEIFPVEVWLSIVNHRGKQLIHTVWRDLTEKKKNEEYLRKLETAVNCAPVAIYITDKNFKIEYINNFLTLLTGYTEEEIIGELCSIFRSNKHSESYYKQMEDTIFDKKVWKNEILAKKKNGDLYWASIIISPILSKNDELSHFLIIKEDISKTKLAREDLIELNSRLRRSERKVLKESKKLSLINKKLEDSGYELLELNKQKDKLISIIAHDLRSPFTGFLGLTDLLLEEHQILNSNDLSKIAKSLNTSAHSTFQLLEDLLDWAQKKDEFHIVNQERIILCQVIDTIIELFYQPLTAKNITIVKNISPNHCIYADKYMLSTIIRNLVSNAIKFTAINGRIEISSLEQDNKYIKIIVRDNGVGMSKEDLKKIFRIDEKHSTPGTDNERGNGLGLILCKEFVEKHGGEIAVDSTINEYTEFCFTMPKSKT